MEQKNELEFVPEENEIVEEITEEITEKTNEEIIEASEDNSCDEIQEEQADEYPDDGASETEEIQIEPDAELVSNTFDESAAESVIEDYEEVIEASDTDIEEQPYLYTEDDDTYGDEDEVRPKKKSKALRIILCILLPLILVGVAAFFGLKYFFAPEVPVIEFVEKPSTLAFCCYNEDPEHGDLYYCLPNKERIKIDSDVREYSYFVMPKTQVVYYAKNEDDFYCCTPGKSPEFLGKDLWLDEYICSDDQKTVLLCYERATAEYGLFDLYIKEDGKDKEKISNSVCSYTITEDGKTVYYIDEDNDLYKWTEEDGEDKIDDCVRNVVASGSALYYDTYSDDISEFNKTFLKLSSSENAEKYYDEFYRLTFGKDGLFALYLSDVVYDDDRGKYGELYMTAGGGEEFKIASDVKAFYMSEDYSKVFYLNSDDILYVRELPEVTESTHKNVEKYQEELREKEKSKLGTQIYSFKMSPDGNSVMYLDKDSSLYVSVVGESRVKVADKVKDFTISNNHFAYISENDELFENTSYRDASKVTKNTKKIDDNITSFYYSDYAQFVSYYVKDENKMYVLSEAGNKDIIYEKVDLYDRITFNDMEMYRKVVSLADIQGLYYLSESDTLFEIVIDEENTGKVYSYGTGEEEEFTVEAGFSATKFELSVQFYQDETFIGSCTFKIDESGNKQIINGYAESKRYYVPEILSTDDFEAKKKEYADEKLKEIKIEQMKELAEDYYYNGYYVSSDETLYSDKNYDSVSDIKFKESGKQYVYSYYIDYDNEVIWLKFYVYNYEAFSRNTVWVPVEYEYVPETEE